MKLNLAPSVQRLMRLTAAEWRTYISRLSHLAAKRKKINTTISVKEESLGIDAVLRDMESLRYYVDHYHDGDYADESLQIYQKATD
jgi:hypothetical protein